MATRGRKEMQKKNQRNTHTLTHPCKRLVRSGPAAASTRRYSRTRPFAHSDNHDRRPTTNRVTAHVTRGGGGGEQPVFRATDAAAAEAGVPAYYNETDAFDAHRSPPPGAPRPPPVKMLIKTLLLLSLTLLLLFVITAVRSYPTGARTESLMTGIIITVLNVRPWWQPTELLLNVLS